MTQIQYLTRVDKVAIGDDYHMSKIDENVKSLKLVHLLSTVFLNLGNPFCIYSFTIYIYIIIAY